MKKNTFITCTLFAQQWFDMLTMHRIVFIICTLSLSKGAISAALNPKEIEPQRFVASLQQLCRSDITQSEKRTHDALQTLGENHPESAAIFAQYINTLLITRIPMQSHALNNTPERRPENSIRSLAFNNDGSLLAVGSDDNIVHIWDITTGHCLHTLEGHDDKINVVAFSPDGRICASGSGDGTVRMWDSTRLRQPALRNSQSEVEDYVGQVGKCLHVLVTQTDPSLLPGSADFIVTAMAFSPCGTTLATGSRRGNVRLWDTHTLELKKMLSLPQEIISSLAFSHDGKTIAAGSSKIYLFNAAIGECIRVFLWVHARRINSLAFSPDDRTILSASADNKIGVCDIETGKCRIMPGHQSSATAAAFCLTGSTVISSSWDGRVCSWDIGKQRYPVPHSLHDFKEPVDTLAISPDGSLIACSTSDVIHILSDYQAHLQTITDPEEREFLLTAATMWREGKLYSVHARDPILNRLLARFPFLDNSKLFFYWVTFTL